MSATIPLPPGFAGAGEAAAARADSALIRVLERMASPLRHDLAGGLLVPQMQLQLLQRKLQRGNLDATNAAAAIDDVLRQLQDLRALHEATVAWLSLRDTRPLVLGEVVGRAATSFSLPFGAREIGLGCNTLACGRVFPAQPLLLLLHAAFWTVLDAIPEAASGDEISVSVGCRDDGPDAVVEWRLSAPTALGSPSAERAPLTVEDLAALCCRFGARFSGGDDWWRLELPAPSNPIDESIAGSGRR